MADVEKEHWRLINHQCCEDCWSKSPWLLRCLITCQRKTVASLCGWYQSVTMPPHCISLLSIYTQWPCQLLLNLRPAILSPVSSIGSMNMAPLCIQYCPLIAVNSIRIYKGIASISAAAASSGSLWYQPLIKHGKTAGFASFSLVISQEVKCQWSVCWSGYAHT